jgi:transcriptional regulator with XRE-family HTH domain
MTPFADRIRQRAAALNLSNAEVARRLDLSERRYAHYVSGTREPDLATLVRIADVLATTPDLLLLAPAEPQDRAKRLLDEAAVALAHLNEGTLELLIVQIRAVSAFASSQAPTKKSRPAPRR